MSGHDFRTGGGDIATFNITGLTDYTGWFQIAVTQSMYGPLPA